MIAARRPYRTALPVLAIVTAALIVALMLLAYGMVGPFVGNPNYTRFESTSPMAGETQGGVKIDDAADRVTISAGDIGNQLYRAKIDYAGTAPRFSSGYGTVQISRASNVFNSWGRPRDVVDLTVNPSVAWSIVIDGAGTTTRIDLSSGRLSSFQINGAGGNVTLVVGSPHGAVHVGVDGVGVSLTMQLPAATYYHVTAEGIGAGVVGVAQTPGWAMAADRYEVAINGVGTHATVTTTG